MNKIMKKLDILPVAVAMAVCVCSFAFVSCGDDEKEGGKVDYDPSKPVVLTSFYPDSGGIASKMIFDGENFGSNPDKIKVYFNSKPAPVIGSSGKRMYAVVPRMPGDTCTVSVVVGDDSVTYNKKFLYKIATTVRTIAGNGSATFNAGTLDKATLDARYVSVDKDNNIFVVICEGANAVIGMVRVNEEENSVTLLARATTQVPSVDPVTGMVTAVNNSIDGMFYTFDPSEGWAMRTKFFKWKEGTPRPTNTWKKGSVYHKLDGYIYFHHYDGHIVKTHPKTYETETITVLDRGDAYGMSFHPLHPNLLYLAFWEGAGVNSHCICTFDVETLEFTKIAGSSGGGYRDGPLDIALFKNPSQIQFDSEGNLYIADSGNHCIRKITTDNMVETVLGIPGVTGKDDGGKEIATFNNPQGICVTESGDMYVADYGNKLLRKLTVE
jgi:hypothetical protein